MNRLRAGAVLRMPGSDEIAAVSPSEASGEVRRLAGSWSAVEWYGRRRTPAAGAAERVCVEPGRDRRQCRRGRGAAGPRHMNSKASSPNPSACSSCAIPNLPTCRRSSPLPSSGLRRLPRLPPAQPPAAEQPAPTRDAAAPETTTPEAAAPTPEPAQTPAAEPPRCHDDPEQQPSATATGEEEPSLIAKLLDNWVLIVGALVLLILGVVFAKSRGKRKVAEFDDNLGRLAEQGEDRLAQPMDSLSDTGRMRAPNMGVDSGRHPGRRIGHASRAAGNAGHPARADGSHRRDHQQRDRGQSRPGRSAGRSRFPHGLWSVRPGRRSRAHRDSARARSSRSEAQAPRSVLRLGQQRAVPHLGARAVRLPLGVGVGEWEKIVIMGKQIAPEDPMFSRRCRWRWWRGRRGPQSRCWRFGPRRLRSVRCQRTHGRDRRRQCRPGRSRSQQRAA